jgi:uncharacterized membrane protein (UPF0127 family)
MTIVRGIESPFSARCCAAALILLLVGCSNSQTGRRNDLDQMNTARLMIKGHAFEAWVADNTELREIGLMNVEQEELARLPDGAHPGMLFSFPSEQTLGFWMKDTIIPLDIAFIRADGRIVRIHTMAPLETRIYSSMEPARYALEVSAGLFAELGIVAGDHVEIPDSVLKATR